MFYFWPFIALKPTMDSTFNKKKPKILRFYGLAFLLIFFLVSLLIDVAVGSVSIPLKMIFSSLFGAVSDDIYYNIIWDLRFPKALTCIMAGAGLGVGGLMMQTFFRNPLAGPDVLGLSSGASLMVAIAILAQGALPFGLGNINPWGEAMAATAGSLLVFIIALSSARKIKENSSLLIIGMMVAAFTSSLVSVLQFLSKAEDLQAFMIWSLGSVGSTNWKEISVLAILIFSGLLISLTCIKPLNAWFLGDNYAKSIGVNIKKARYRIIFSTSLMVGTITAFCGPIAFVGLAVPHLIKLLLPASDHKILLPAVALGGAILLLICDTLTQLPSSAQVLPLNAVTSLLGAPVLIWVVVRNKRNV